MSSTSRMRMGHLGISPRAFAAILSLAGAAAMPGAALAQVRDATWVIRGAAFFPKVDTQVRADGNNGLIGSSIDFESDLGLDDSKTLGTFDVAWRFAPNHRLELGYLDLSRSATSVLRGSITWQGRVYPINTNVNGEFDSKITAFSYLYSFYHTPETELAAGIGIHNANIKAGVSIVGGAAEASREVSANAPLPVVALRWGQRFSDSVGGELRYQWFGIKAGDYDGSLNVVTAVASWFPWKNFGFEGGYSYSRYDLKVQKDSWRGEAKYEFSGPIIALVATF